MNDAAPPPARFGRIVIWLFAALGVATALAIIWLVIMIGGTWDSREPAVVAGKAAPGEVLVVGNIELLEGTGLIAIEIGVPQGGTLKSGSGSGHSIDETRNLLLLDRKTGTSRRVLPDNGTAIDEIRYFPAVADSGAVGRYDGDGDGQPAFYMLTLERELANGDKVYDLLAGTLATGKQGIVMRGLSGIQQFSMLDTTRLGLVVREDKALYYRVIDIPALKQVESYKIEIG
jgi:hypothetical protein